MKKVVIIISLFFSITSVSQSKRTADKYFKEYAYVKAAELYERIVEKGDFSSEVLSRLADAYYFNSITGKAEVWYKKLIFLYEKKNIDPEYYFRLSQCLKSNGKHKEADQWLLKFHNVKRADSRGKRFINNTNYMSEYAKKENNHVKVHNVAINSKYSDYGAYKLGATLYFSSTRPEERIDKMKLYQWNKQPLLNIYRVKDSVIHRETIRDSETYTVEKIPGINTVFHNASAITTKDEKTMYFTGDNFDGKKLKSDASGITHLKIYKATLKNGIWTAITALPFNSDDYSTGHPALSPNEKELYFVSDMPGGYGHTDIYKVAILPEGTYSRPVNLGKKINTEGREMFPFVSNDNQLFFSSDGHLGIGLLDIFKSEIHTNSYSEPMNLEVPFNSLKDDFAFTIDTSKNNGYFSSNREGGKGDDDIYGFTIYDCKTAVKGIAYNKSDKSVLPKIQVALVNSKGKIIDSTLTDIKGNYIFSNTECDQTYALVGNKGGYVSDTTEIITSADNESVVESELFLAPLIVDYQIMVHPIFFDFDSADIREDAEYELEKIVTVMKQYPELVIRITSHTDARGNHDYNKRLSDRRAKSSGDYIISRGIDASRIESTIGFGENQLLNHCNDANAKKCTDEEHQKNRRSYFYIVE
ncbi:MAG: OmpA family protein [Flavobacteriaceae bacterium]|nr:MAG: OmpA family protein [Flavobacteriaceae bacterium]